MILEHAIRPEGPKDAPAISALHREAFGADDPVPRLVEGLRRLEAPLATMSYVAVDMSENIVGHVMVSHAWLDAPDRLIDLLVLSPLGVLPGAQRQGIGTALLKHAVAQADSTPAPILILEGNPAFYGPRGFQAAHLFGIRRPSLRIPQAALQLVRLASYDQRMTGTFVYRDVFWEHDCVGLRRTTNRSCLEAAQRIFRTDEDNRCKSVRRRTRQELRHAQDPDRSGRLWPW